MPHCRASARCDTLLIARELRNYHHCYFIIFSSTWNEICKSTRRDREGEKGKGRVTVSKREEYRGYIVFHICIYGMCYSMWVLYRSSLKLYRRFACRKKLLREVPGDNASDLA